MQFDHIEKRSFLADSQRMSRNLLLGGKKSSRREVRQNPKDLGLCLRNVIIWGWQELVWMGRSDEK